MLLAGVAACDLGQQLISGMGELHLEITLDRLRREHGVEVELDRMRVAYRESVSHDASAHVRPVWCPRLAASPRVHHPMSVSQSTFDRTLGNKQHFARMAVSVQPAPSEENVIRAGTGKDGRLAERVE